MPYARLAVCVGEIVRDLVNVRSSGTKLARPKGSLGVSRFDGREDPIRHFLNLGVSTSTIAKITGITRAMLCYFIATLGLKAAH